MRTRNSETRALNRRLHLAWGLTAVALAVGFAPPSNAQGVFGKEATVPKIKPPPTDFRLDNTGATSFGFYDGDPRTEDATYVIALAGGAQLWFGEYYMTARNFLIWTDSPANGSAKEAKPTFPYAPIDPIATGAGVARPSLDNLTGASLLPGVEAASTTIGQLREIYAEGDVYIEQRSAGGKNIFQATRAYFNVIEDRSLIIQGELRTDLKSATSLTGEEATTTTTTDSTSPPVPIVFRAAEIRGVAKGLFEADNAQLTTCTFAEPGYHIAVDHLIYEQRATELSGRVTGMGNQLVIDDRPLIALPYLEIRTGADSPFPLIGADFGGSTKLGFFVKTRWGNVFEQAGIDFNTRLGITGEFKGKWWVDINWYSKRGLGLGAGIAYETTVVDPITEKKQPKYEGVTEFFFINDISGEDEVGEVNQSGFRSRFKTLNRVFLPDDWRLDAELDYVSDENFLREFFGDSTSYQESFRKEKEPETVAYLRKLSGDTAVTSTLRYRLNTWQTQTEYLPQATYDVISRPIAEFDTLGEALGRPDALRLYWTHRTEVAYVNRLVSDELETSDNALDEFENDISADDNVDTTDDNDPNTSPLRKSKKKGKNKPSWLAANEDENDDVVPGDDLDPTVTQSVRSNDPFLDARERQFRAEGSAVRIDDIERFNLPFDVGPVGIDPYFENRLTYWLGDMEIDGGGGMREGMTIGFNASTQFWKTIPDYESEFFNIHGLRHILIPNLRYRYTFLSTQDSNDLVPYDSVERFDTLHALVPGIRSRYQTKRLTRYGRETTTFLDIDIQQPYIFENGRQEGLANLLEDEQGNRRLNEFETIDDGTGFGDFWVDVRYRPDIDYYLLRRSYIRNTLAWNLEEGQLDQYRLEFQTEPGPDFFARVQYSYAQASNVSPTLALDGFLLNRDSDRNLNTLTFELAYQMTRRWEFVLRDELELPTFGIGDVSFMLRRRTHDWLFEFRLGVPGGGGGFGVGVRPLAFAKRSERDRYKTALSDGYDLTPLFDVPDFAEGPAFPSSEETQKP